MSAIVDFRSVDGALSRIDAAIKASDAKPTPLPPELPAVAPFPLLALPDAFRPWVADVSEHMQCPPDFVAVPLLVAAASLVARHVCIRPQARTNWREHANLWAMIVGRPGIMKSPALAQALAPIQRLEARGAAVFNELASQHQADALAAKLRCETNVNAARAKLKKDAGADILGLLRADGAAAEPIRQRYVTTDATYESLGAILADHPGGVLLERDELRGLFLYWAREDAAQARAFYLQAWSGGRYTFDRIGRGTVTVEDARLSIVGGIQPGPLVELMRQARRGAADDGMIERFLVAWPDSPGAWREVDRDPDSSAWRRVWEAFDRLDGITDSELCAEVEAGIDGEPRGLPFLRFADDARECFVEWRSELEAKLRGAETETLEGALSKFRHHVPALALVRHVVDGGTGPVTLAPTLAALELADYFESHARRLHSSHQRLAVLGARTILSKARAGVLADPFTARDVYRKHWSGLDERATSDALDMLVDSGWLIEVSSVATGGRPTMSYCLSDGARHG